MIRKILEFILGLFGRKLYKEPGTPKGGTRVPVSKTIVVPSGKTFDGKGKLYDAVKHRLGDGSQKEGQKPIFELERGARLRNCYIAGADGVHCRGDNRVESCSWTDVGEDALTVWAGDVVVRACQFFDGEDKAIQINSDGGKVVVDKCDFVRVGKAIRTNGNESHRNHAANLVVTRSRFFTCGWGIYMSGPKKRGKVEGCEFHGVEHPIKANHGAKISQSGNKGV